MTEPKPGRCAVGYTCPPWPEPDGGTAASAPCVPPPCPWIPQDQADLCTCELPVFVVAVKSMTIVECPRSVEPPKPVERWTHWDSRGVYDEH